MEVLILERSWTGLDTVGCRVGLGSTTIGCSDITGSGWGVTLCGTSPGVTTGTWVIETFMGSTNMGSTNDSGLKIKGVAAFWLIPGSLSNELEVARVFTAYDKEILGCLTLGRPVALEELGILEWQ